MSMNEMESKIRELRQLQALIDEATAEAEAIKDAIKAHMGDTEELRAGEYKGSLGKRLRPPGWTPRPLKRPCRTWRSGSPRPPQAAASAWHKKSPLQERRPKQLARGPTTTPTRGAGKPNYSPPAPRNQEIGAKNMCQRR